MGKLSRTKNGGSTQRTVGDAKALTVGTSTSGELSVSNIEERALALRNSIDDAIAIADGDISQLRKLGKQAEALEDLVRRDMNLRGAANTIGIARLKIAAAIGAAMKREVGGRGKTHVHGTGVLSSHTIAKYRKVADRAKFIEKYEKEIAESDEVSISGFIRYSEPEKPQPVETPFSNGADIVCDLEELVGTKFGTIYADPPWKYGNQGTRAATDNHYRTMTVEEVCNLPVLDVAADNAHLHLWTTNAFLFDARLVMEAWGFEYRSCFVWVKPQMGIGNYWRVAHEFLLLGVRGNAKGFAERNHMSWGSYDRREHSAKPEKLRSIIERVSPGPRLELFGRRQVEGWTVYGNQVELRSVPA